MTTATITLTEIETCAKTYAGCRDILNERLTALRDELASARNRRLTGIKLALANAKEAQSKLEQVISAGRDLFNDPRTVVVHGIKVGIVKAKGRIEWDDEPRVVSLIEKYFPGSVDILVKTTKKPIKKALSGLTVAELKKIGCTMTEAGDVVLIKPVDDEVDKLVAALLEEESSEDDDN